MPKAKRVAQPPRAIPQPPLKDCHVAFTRITKVGIGGISQADLTAEIVKHGGVFVSKIDQCTHLIASEEQYQKNLSRVKEALTKGDVTIVTFDWLQDSFNATCKIDEAKYSLHPSGTDVKDKSLAGNKRARTATDDEVDDKSVVSKKAKAERDVPKAKETAVSMNVPLDEGLLDQGNYKVLIGDDGTIYDITLNQTNAGNNNNKFYRIQLLVDNSDKHWCWTRWGRVGERGQSKMLGDGSFDLAFKEFGKKFKDKNGNTWEKRLEPIKSGKYSYIERSYEDSDNEDIDKNAKTGNSIAVKKEEDDEDEDEEKPVQSKLAEPVQRLMKLIFNQEYFDSTLADLDYDANKMPLGKLSKNTLLRGYIVLKELTAILGTGTTGSITDLSNQYFSLIPHAFGRNRPPVLSNMPMIKKEIELLESLTDMQLANDIMKNARGKKGLAERINLLDRQYDGLGMQEMTALDHGSTEFRELQDYLVKSGGHTHSIRYQVQDIFRIERRDEDSRFESSKFANISNSDRRLLWHGSRCTNFGGILSQGLRIAPPEAPVSGYMFGKGVYLADMSTKSANYCCSYSSGGVGLLLLCEAELGKPPLKLVDSNYNAGEDAAKQGSISTWGVGMHAPLGWKDAGCVHKSLKGIKMPDVLNHPPGPTNENGAWLQYNEFIIYDIAQRTTEEGASAPYNLHSRRLVAVIKRSSNRAVELQNIVFGGALGQVKIFFDCV